MLAYAYTVIRSDRDREAMILTGSDDTITVWVNGQKVLAKKVARAITIDEDKAMVRLKKGDNPVLVKVCQAGGGWATALAM